MSGSLNVHRKVIASNETPAFIIIIIIIIIVIMIIIIIIIICHYRPYRAWIYWRSL